MMVALFLFEKLYKKAMTVKTHDILYVHDPVSINIFYAKHPFSGSGRSPNR